MPPIAKKYKVYKTESDKSVSEKDSPEKSSKPKVISGQLEKSIIKKHKKPYKTKRGVVFLKNLPNGFFEEQLQRYFQQFGKITRVRLARSIKSCAPKGFAFIEFAIPEVAEIAAETMNNYLMFKKIVKAAYIPPDEQKFDYFRTSVKKVKTRFGKEKFVSCKTRLINRQKRHLNNWSDENYVKRTQKQERKLSKMKQTLSDLDLDVDSIVRRPAEKLEDKSTSSEETKIAVSQSKKKKKQKAAKEELPGSSDAKAKTSDTPGTTSDENSIAKNKNGKLKRKVPEISKNKGKESRIDANESNSSSQDKKQKHPKKKPIANGKSSSSDPTSTNDEGDQSITPPAKTRSRKNVQSVSTSIDSSPTTEPTSSASEKSKKGKQKLPKLSAFKDPSGYVVESLFESNFNGDDDIVLDDTFEIDSAKQSPDSTPESAGKKKSKTEKDKIPLKRLLEDTIEDDSSDEDFELEEELESDESEESDEEVEDTKPKTKRNKSDNSLKRLMESTLEDDSSDEEFELEEESSDLSEEDDDDEDEEQDSSPQKSKNKKSSEKVHATARLDKLDKIAQRKLHEGGIQKKQKQKKPQKSQALKQKIQETVKAMVTQKNIVSLKPKGTKAGGLDVKKEKQMKKNKKRGL